MIIRSGLSGLGVTLLCSVSVNLAELRRAQTRVGKEDWGLEIGYWGLGIGDLGLGNGGLTARGRALKNLLTR